MQTSPPDRHARFLLTAAILVIALSAIIYLPVLRGSAPVPDAAKVGYRAIDGKEMEAFLRFIASDELEGRETGTRGLKVAAKFLEVQYALAGLKPVPGHDSMLQPFSVDESLVSSASKIEVAIGGDDQPHPFSNFEDFVVLSQYSENVQTEFPVVFAGYGLKDEHHNDYVNIGAAGKLVLVLDGSPELEKLRGEPNGGRQRKLRTMRRSKAKWAESAGAAGIVHINPDMTPETISRFRRFLERPRQRLTDMPAGIHQLIITAQVADALLSNNNLTVAKLLEEGGAKKAGHVELKARLKLDLQVSAQTKWSQNVVAYLEGSDPELKNEVVVFGAHYDHIGKRPNGDIYNGADDDGSGTVGILEIARAFASNDIRPKRSLLFVSHAGEEKGLLGSRFYTENPMVPLEQTMAQLNIDMIGRNDPNSVYIIGSNFLSRELHKINVEANQTVGLNLDYKYNDLADPNRFYYRSDHYNYAKHGIPIIFYFSGTHEDYHKPTDTVDKINFAKMKKVAQLVYLTGWELANLDHHLAKDGLLLE